MRPLVRHRKQDIRKGRDQVSLKQLFLGIRGKLIAIFVVIKVVPMVLIALLAWSMAQQLGGTVSERASAMADGMLSTIRQVGDKVTGDAINALDDRARESMERLSTDTAHAIAAFLYDRDADLLQAAQLPPDEASYRSFLTRRKRPLYVHGAWRLAADGKHWEPETPVSADVSLAADPKQALPDNAKAFSARPPAYLGQRELRPLFVEMTFVDLDGRERVKVVNDGSHPPALRNVSDRKQTFAKAERYWPELKKLKPGEIYVSDVIGAYVGSQLVGPYTPAAAAKAGIPYAPEESAYAGTENPVGRHFRGIVRWATPVLRNGRIAGYVTLALDHDHIRQFTDRISPTDVRYIPIDDAIEGNYAFMWDHRSRAISHPRDYFIAGYDPATGEPVAPWMDQSLYEGWQASGKPAYEFLSGVQAFDGQSLKKKPAAAMLKAGTIGLDCRYLNFSPQCAGWHQLTEKGGSGSFVIFFSGLWKLTTAAAIPYYTGQYGASPRGFGIVTIGANVDDFHRAATASARQIADEVAEKDRLFKRERASMLGSIASNLGETAAALSLSTALMIAVVIGVAIWMAQFLTGNITAMIRGIERFQSGDLGHRLEVRSHDEMGQLAQSFNHMADSVQESFRRSEEARARAEEANQLKTDFLANISHELRTPLNGILGFAELLEMDLADPGQREYAATIRQSGEHLLHIVNDLLDLAKIEAGQIVLNPASFKLAQFADEVLSGHRAHAQQKGLELSLELAPGLPADFVSDAMRLRQILNNLLNNAIKFTDNGRVVLAISCRDGRLAFAVRDTGRGIP
ncbi:MAG: HAMP domain-containing protein, partial [Zoogloea sp.]|nr:HAMP domain-containing protein [Zoogloea sp.]